MPDSKLTYNGTSSDDIGDIIVTKSSLNNRPMRKYESVSVPGRNGNLMLFQDAYENVTRSYEIAAGSGADDCVTDKFYEIAEWLMPEDTTISVDDYINLTYGGYHRLQEGNDDAIMLAYFMGPFNVEHTLTRLGRATISFSCRPERFTSDAFTAISITASGTSITNPGRKAKPCVKVYGSGAGAVVVNGYVCTISNITSYLYIDSDSQNCFREISDSNQNSLVSLTNGFPVLRSGANVISFSGGVTSVDIYPRWWKL